MRQPVAAVTPEGPTTKVPVACGTRSSRSPLIVSVGSASSRTPVVSTVTRRATRAMGCSSSEVVAGPGAAPGGLDLWGPAEHWLPRDEREEGAGRWAQRLQDHFIVQGT